MPFVNDLPPEFSYGFIDNNNNRATTSIHLPPGTDLDGVPLYADAIEAALAALSNARLDRGNISYRLRQVPPANAALTPESEVERKLAITFETAQRTNAIFYVPSPVFGLEVDGSDFVPLSNPLVAALVTLMIQGPAGAGNGVVTSAGLDLIRATQAKVIHRNRRSR